MRRAVVTCRAEGPVGRIIRQKLQKAARQKLGRSSLGGRRRYHAHPPPCGWAKAMMGPESKQAGVRMTDDSEERRICSSLTDLALGFMRQS